MNGILEHSTDLWQRTNEIVVQPGFSNLIIVVFLGAILGAILYVGYRLERVERSLNQKK